MWGVFSLPDPRNKDKRWDILLHQSRFPLDCAKRHVQSLLKGSEADQYVVQNLTWSGVYRRSTLSNILLQKVLTLVLLTATGPEVFVATMTTFLSDLYDALKETLNYIKSLKLKIYPGENVTDCFAAILVDAEHLESAGGFKPEHLGYITCIFEDNSNSIFRLWDIQKYKEVTEFIKKLRVYDMDVISQEDHITYESLVQEATQEYHDLGDSKRWEPDTSKENSPDQTSLPKAYTVVIEQSTNKAFKQVGFKSRHSGNFSGSGKGSSARSDITCHKCSKKCHIKKDCRSKGNGSSGNTPKKSTNELPEWVTMKPVVSDTKDLTTVTMTCNNKK